MNVLMLKTSEIGTYLFSKLLALNGQSAAPCSETRPLGYHRQSILFKMRSFYDTAWNHQTISNFCRYRNHLTYSTIAQSKTTAWSIHKSIKNEPFGPLPKPFLLSLMIFLVHAGPSGLPNPCDPMMVESHCWSAEGWRWFHVALRTRQWDRYLLE